jgi:hypothetical protein
MELFGFDKTKPPDFVSQNDKGQDVKWWHCKSLTEYAVCKNNEGISLSDVRGWLKRWKARKERRAAKKNPECQDGYGKYKGYET